MAAKITTVKAARKGGKVCGRCRKPIEIGQGYLSWEFRFGPAHVRCLEPDCYPKHWELESNAKRASLMQAQSWVDEAATVDPAGAAEHLQSAASAVEEVYSEMQEALDGWASSGLDQTERYANWEQGVADLEDWKDTTETLAATLADLANSEPEQDTEEYEEWEAEAIASLEEITEIPEVEF